jgi:protein-S-isoprenylcysteine O-methyltransferase Ste14
MVRRDYLQHGKLTRLTSLAQLLVFGGIMAFPYLFNPPQWPWIWLRGDGVPVFQWLAGLLIVLLGFAAAFATMGWFGLQRAFGRQVQGLVQAGPYRYTRNPQILGGYLLVIGTSIQWPSWYALGWIGLYGIIGHWMVLTEEEHLRAVFGEAYARYCQRTPRYLCN